MDSRFYYLNSESLKIKKALQIKIFLECSVIYNMEEDGRGGTFRRWYKEVPIEDTDVDVTLVNLKYVDGTYSLEPFMFQGQLIEKVWFYKDCLGLEVPHENSVLARCWAIPDKSDDFLEKMRQEIQDKENAFLDSGWSLVEPPQFAESEAVYIMFHSELNIVP